MKKTNSASKEYTYTSDILFNYTPQRGATSFGGWNALLAATVNHWSLMHASEGEGGPGGWHRLRDGRSGTLPHPAEEHLLHDGTQKVMNSLILKVKNCTWDTFCFEESDCRLFVWIYQTVDFHFYYCCLRKFLATKNTFLCTCHTHWNVDLLVE